MIAVAASAVLGDGCGNDKPSAAFHRSYYPDRDGRYVQPCKACMKAAREASPPPTADLDLQEVAATMASLVTYALDLGTQALPKHTAVQLLVDALDCLEDPDEISQAGRYPPPSPSHGEGRPGKGN